MPDNEISFPTNKRTPWNKGKIITHSNRSVSGAHRPLPLFIQLRTYRCTAPTVAKGHLLPHAPQQRTA
jgi:hypothetical protein